MLKTVSSWRSFGGKLDVFDHVSSVCRTTMRFAVFSPPQTGKVPVLWYLSGLTCTWENVMTKAGLQRTAAELGVMVIAPDTSPRGEGVPDDAAYDLGQGAGFYLSATQAPWSTHLASRISTMVYCSAAFSYLPRLSLRSSAQKNRRS